MKPRIFIRFALLFFCALSIAWQGPSDHFLRGPYLGSVTQNGMTISWNADRATTGAVLYGKAGSFDSVLSDESEGTFHGITLRGLQASTEYGYKCVSGKDTSAAYSFRTAVKKGEPFVFAVYGDTRTNHKAHALVLKQMQAVNPCFVLHTGDLVSSNTPANWDNYFTDLCRTTTIGCTTPFFSCPGNHDAGSMYYDLLSLPSNNSEKSKAYYSFAYGDVFVLCLNTEIPFSAGSAQNKWLLEVMASQEFRSAKFTIAIWHRPPYSSSSHGSDLDVRAAFCPLMEKNNVDVVFNGHDHCYERTTPFQHTTYIVSGGGGAPLYDFSSRNDWTAYKEKTHHFCKVSIENNTLRMYMIRDDGKVRDSLIIKK